MFYLVKTPWLLQKLYPGCVWKIPSAREHVVYLTFDDGPHPVATSFVLDALQEYKAQATFFCIGKNVAEQPALYRRILEAGHAVGNHTNNHLNGWRTDDMVYMENIRQAAKYIDSSLFRPPYGKITRFQLRLMQGAGWNMKTIMWSILSGDFDTKLSGEACLKNVVRYCQPGSIIVFHDSEKAFTRLRYALPEALKILSGQGYQFKKLSFSEKQLK